MRQGGTPTLKARLKEHDFVAQIMTRDEQIGRWIEFKGGNVILACRIACQSRHQIDVQECRDRRFAFDAADQLARPDQCSEGFRSYRRRAGASHQLVRANSDDEPNGRAQILARDFAAALSATAT